jgi:hypothetical protein
MKDSLKNPPYTNFDYSSLELHNSPKFQWWYIKAFIDGFWHNLCLQLDNFKLESFCIFLFISSPMGFFLRFIDATSVASIHMQISTSLLAWFQRTLKTIASKHKFDNILPKKIVLCCFWVNFFFKKGICDRIFCFEKVCVTFWWIFPPKNDQLSSHVEIECFCHPTWYQHKFESIRSHHIE